MEPNGPLPRNLWLLVLGLLGISAAGTLVANRGGADSGQALPSSRESSRPGSTADGAATECRIRPRGFHRALSLVLDYHSTAPLYVPDPDNRLILNPQPSEGTPSYNLLRSRCQAYEDRGQGLESTKLDTDLVDLTIAGLREADPDVTLDILIATLPDWVNSSSSWTFDPMLGAIQSAAAAVGYTLHSFYLPGWDPNIPDLDEVSSLRVRTPTMHHSEPGAVLFRSTKSDKLLLVLIVGETATSGVHNEAMGAALDLAMLWRDRAFVVGSGTRSPVRIIGPTFSGTAPSLRHALGAAFERRHLSPTAEVDRSTCDHSRPVVELISHSATSIDVARELARWTPKEGCVIRYRAVVRTTRDTIPEVQAFLRTLSHRSRQSLRTAILQESNTAYGLAGRSAADTTVFVQFPMHLSQLRGAVSDLPAMEKPASTPITDALRLPLAAGRTTTDKLPPMTPRITAALTELTLRSELDRLRARGVTSVGIIATDRRDHVFLSMQIARRLPNVIQFAVQPDMIFQHSDVNGFVRGTVVASTYSLAPRVDALSAPDAFARQFRGHSEQGMFNATLAQLGRDDLLLGYGVPPGMLSVAGGEFEKCRASSRRCQPPVWISVIGRTRAYPLAIRIGDESYADHLFQPDRATRTTGPRERLLRVPPAFLVLTMSLVLAVAWHVGLFLRRDVGRVLDGTANQRTPSTAHGARQSDLRALLRRRWDLVTERPSVDASNTPERRERRFDRIREYRTALFACSLGVVVASLWLWTHFVVWVLDFWTAWDPRAWQLASDSATTVVSGAASAAVATLLVAAYWAFAMHPSRTIRPRVLVVVFVATICLGIGGRVVLRQLQPADDGVLTAILPVLLGMVALLTVAGLSTGGNRGVSAAIPADSNRRSRLVLAIYRTGVVALALVSAVFIVAFVASKRMDLEAVLFVDRSLDILSLVSPTSIVLSACGVAYWWGAWNLRRLDVMLLPDIEVGVGEFIQRRARRVGAVAQISGSRRQLGTAAPLAIMTIAVALVFGYRFVSSIDGALFSDALFLATTCIIAMMVHVLAYNVDFATGLLRTLESIERHVAAARFGELADMSLSWRPTFRVLTRPDLEPFLVRLMRLDAALKLCRVESPSRLPTEQITRVIGALEHLAEESISDSLWQEIDEASKAMLQALRKSVWVAGYDVTRLTEPERQALHEMEVLVIGHSALILRDLAARLLSGFAAVVGGLLILMTGHLLYAFQGRAFWLTFDWTVLAVASLLALVFLSRLERNPVLRRLWKTESGRLAVLGGIPMRIVGYVVLIIVTMVAVFFPEVAGGLFKWAEPVRSLMP